MNGRDGGELGLGGGRDRFRREIRESHGQYQSRFDEKTDYGGARNPRPAGRSGGGDSPPSRHLWVGNLAHGVSEAELSRHFRRFGELESVAFQPGRSYAFVNFAAEEDAVDAIEALQGFPVAGNPLRIEFAKADKSSAHSHDENYSQRRDELRSGIRDSPFSQKEFRTRHSSHDQSYADNSSMNDKNTEPSPVLWVGFPASLKVDEMVLRRAFAPFGAIEKITAFPGRSYAFIRFENVVSACNAKDTLQGKLFDNPRVHICFAKNESGSSNTERNSMNVPPSPHFKFGGRQESSEDFRRDRNFTNPTRTRSPHLFSNLDSGDPDPYTLSRQGTMWTDNDETFEQRRFGERGSEYQTTPTRGKRGRSHDFPQRFPQTSAFHDEQWNFSEDVRFPHEPKKLKNASFHRERELPDYPYPDREHDNHRFAGNLSDFPQTNPSDRSFDRPLDYQQISDFPPQREWRDSYDGSYQMISGSGFPVERKRLTPESDNPSMMKEWKWEGIIAKGGTPVCRARCFPVGKTLDTTLPEFLDCTARTGLDMLAKHYYQATNAWVVFFVPGSDADIGSYNEFMHYLEDKQRAAVSKIDENTTLFLVPPSYFSEKVLKVPGRLSMSGVILTLEHPGSDTGSFHRHPEHEDPANMSSRGNTSYPNPLPPPHAIPPYFPDFHSNSSHVPAGRSENFDSNIRHEYPLHGDPRPAPSWPSPNPANSASGTGIVPPSQPALSPYDSMAQRHPSVTKSSSYTTGGASGIAGFQPGQLAQLASSLLGQQRQSGNRSQIESAPGYNLRPVSSLNESDQVLRTPQMSSDLSSPQFGQAQQLQRASNVPAVPQMAQRDGQNSAPQEADSDPQHRLQATLQLAAALLQQIQQGKGS